MSIFGGVLSRPRVPASVGVLSLALVLLAAPASGSTVDEQWPQPNTYQDGHYSLTVSDEGGGFQHFPLLETWIGDEGFVCTSTKDGECAKARDFHYKAVLPLCESAAQLNCVESLTALHPDGTVDEGQFQGYTLPNHPNLYSPDPAIKIPLSATPMTWELAKTQHSTGSLYALAVTIEGGSGPENPRPASEINIALAAVLPKIGTGTNTDINGYENFPKCIQLVNPVTGKHKIGCGGGAEEFGSYACSFKSANGGCLLRQPMPLDIRFQLRVRLSDTPTGWLHGRMESPEISINKFGTGVLLEVTAAPLRVPTFYGGAMYGDLSEAVKSYYSSCLAGGTCHVGSRQARPFGDPLPAEQRNVLHQPAPMKQESMVAMAAWREMAMDSSVAEPTTWTMRTTALQGSQESNKCLAPDTTGVKGIVTTNATAYSDGPPTFAGGRLTYTVMAPHYRPDGKSLFLGRYNLVMRSDVARCLYGFSNAPLQASISVVNADGANVVATTAVSERDGWLSLSANGFTFSQPQIVVTLNQEAPSAPKPVVAPAKVKKTSIICLRGTTKQKVSSLSPACPKGWKKR